MQYDQEHDPYRGFRGVGDLGPGKEQTALIVIDMQNCFCHPDVSFAKLGPDITMLADAIPGCVELVEAARAAGVPVIYTQAVFRPDYRDGGIIFNELKKPITEVGAMIAGSWDAEIVDELRPRPEDFIVLKHRFSAFYGTDLEVILSSLQIGSLVICGVTTNICVETTARDAAQRNFRTYVVRDATGEVDPVKHDHALTTLEYAFCRTTGKDDVIAAWTGRKAAAPTAV